MTTPRPNHSFPVFVVCFLVDFHVTADGVKSSWANLTLAEGTAIVSWESIAKKAPTIFLACRKEPGVVGDIHDPVYALRVLGRYKELYVGDSAELVHSLNDPKDNQVMQFLPKFVRSLTKPK